MRRKKGFSNLHRYLHGCEESNTVASTEVHWEVVGSSRTIPGQSSTSNNNKQSTWQPCCRLQQGRISIHYEGQLVTVLYLKLLQLHTRYHTVPHPSRYKMTTPTVKSWPRGIKCSKSSEAVLSVWSTRQLRKQRVKSSLSNMYVCHRTSLAPQAN